MTANAVHLIHTVVLSSGVNRRRGSGYPIHNFLVTVMTSVPRLSVAASFMLQPLKVNDCCMRTVRAGESN